MVGLGIGNLMGLPFESWPAYAIAQEHPDGVRNIHAEKGWPDDDDLAQAIVLAQAAATGDGLDIDDLAHRFWEWAELNGAGMGPHTTKVIRRHGGDWPQRGLRNYKKHGRIPTGVVRKPLGESARNASRMAWKQSWSDQFDDYNAGNGAVMRCAPVAIRWADDDAAVARNSVVSAAVTHWDPRCLWSAMLLNLAAASYLRGESPGDAASLLERGRQSLRHMGAEAVLFDLDADDDPPWEIRENVNAALRDDVDIDRLQLGRAPTAFTIKTLSAALWCVHNTDSFDQGLSTIISAGGDTDTNGAAAGALLGAKFGLSTIPQRWQERIREIRSYVDNRIDSWWAREPLETYADDLLSKRGT